MTSLLLFHRVHKEELKKRGVRNFEEKHNEEFVDWFENHVRKLRNAPKDLSLLSKGPDKRVRAWHACNVNGVRFRTVDSEKDRRTQNSGIMMKVGVENSEEERELYGVLKQVLEVNYGGKSVFLFRCDWFDLDGQKKKSMKMKSDGFFRSVNTSAFWYQEAPFMLASQASTCIYLEDTKLGDPWKVVVPIGPRGTYDVPENFDGEHDATVQAYQEAAHSSPHRIAADVEDEVEDHDATGNVEDEEEEDDAFQNVDDEDDERDEALGVSVPANVVEEIQRKFEEGNEDFDISEDERVDEEEIDPELMDSDLD